MRVVREKEVEEVDLSIAATVDRGYWRVGRGVQYWREFHLLQNDEMYIWVFGADMCDTKDLDFFMGSSQVVGLRS